MQREYHYFVSGLYDLWVDEAKLPISTQEFKELARQSLHPEDKKLAELLYLPYDNKNLLRILNQEELSGDVVTGNYSIDFLHEQLKEPTLLPQYMQCFLAAQSEEQELFSNVLKEDQLTWLYYDYAIQCENHFLRDYLNFDLNVNNCITLLNCKKIGISPEPYIISSSEVANAMRIEGLSSNTVLDLFPEAETITSLWENDEVVERERDLDGLRWNKIDELNLFNYFTAEVIFGYTLRISMIERWVSLDEKKGKELFSQSIKEMKRVKSLTEKMIT